MIMEMVKLKTLMDFAPVAQLDRVADFESEGCRFESCRARLMHQNSKHLLNKDLLQTKI
jgi:hypothetical protein